MWETELRWRTISDASARRATEFATPERAESYQQRIKPTLTMLVLQVQCPSIADGTHHTGLIHVQRQANAAVLVGKWRFGRWWHLHSRLSAATCQLYHGFGGLVESRFSNTDFSSIFFRVTQELTFFTTPQPSSISWSI